MNKYIERIKKATTKDELHQISYDFLKNENYTIFSKENALIDHLCVYKECLLENASKKDLEECIKVFKLSQKLIKEIP